MAWETIVLGQFVAKFVGGFLWSLVLQKFLAKTKQKFNLSENKS
jgi:hypothetical protein